MAKVDKPRFNSFGDVACEDCPFENSDEMCGANPCPDLETYEAACKLAEEARQ